MQVPDLDELTRIFKLIFNQLIFFALKTQLEVFVEVFDFSNTSST